MNEFERRQLETAQNHVDLKAVVASLNRTAVVEHFGYVVPLGVPAGMGSLVNAITQTGIVAMQADAYFVLQYISVCVIKPDNPWYMQDAGNILLQITDTGAGEVLYNTQGIGGILAGTATRAQVGVPLLLPIPRIIPPNTNVKIEATQLGVNVGTNQQPVAFFCSLIGSRVASV